MELRTEMRPNVTLKNPLDIQSLEDRLTAWIMQMLMLNRLQVTKSLKESTFPSNSVQKNLKVRRRVMVRCLLYEGNLQNKKQSD